MLAGNAQGVVVVVTPWLAFAAVAPLVLAGISCFDMSAARTRLWIVFSPGACVVVGRCSVLAPRRVGRGLAASGGSAVSRFAGLLQRGRVGGGAAAGNVVLPGPAVPWSGVAEFVLPCSVSMASCGRLPPVFSSFSAAGVSCAAVAFPASFGVALATGCATAIFGSRTAGISAFAVLVSFEAVAGKVSLNEACGCCISPSGTVVATNIASPAAAARIGLSAFRFFGRAIASVA